MRQLHDEAAVQPDPDGQPLGVMFRGQFLQVLAVLDSWEWAGDWVTGLSERHYWLVSTDTGLLLELYEEQDMNKGRWFVSGVQD